MGGLKQPMPSTHPEADLKSLVCGSCQWFLTGYQGENCQKLRQAEIDTPACHEFTLPMEDPFYETTKDKYIQKIRTFILSDRFKIDSTVLQELKSYVLEENLGRYRFGTQQDLEGISIFIKNIVLCRARVSNIYTNLLDVKYEFEETLSHAHLWLYSKYPIVQIQKNETARKAAFHRIMPEVIEVQKDLEKNLAVAKYVDDYLDSNERACSKILGSSERLWFSKEQKVRS